MARNNAATRSHLGKWLEKMMTNSELQANDDLAKSAAERARWAAVLSPKK